MGSEMCIRDSPTNCLQNPLELLVDLVDIETFDMHFLQPQHTVLCARRILPTLPLLAVRLLSNLLFLSNGGGERVQKIFQMGERG